MKNNKRILLDKTLINHLHILSNFIVWKIRRKLLGQEMFSKKAAGSYQGKSNENELDQSTPL